MFVNVFCIFCVRNKNIQKKIIIFFRKSLLGQLFFFKKNFKRKIKSAAKINISLNINNIIINIKKFSNLH